MSMGYYSTGYSLSKRWRRVRYSTLHKKIAKSGNRKSPLSFSRTLLKPFSASVCRDLRFTFERCVFAGSHCGANSSLPFVWPHTSKTNANWYDTDRPVGLCTSGATKQDDVCAWARTCDRKWEQEGGKMTGWRRDGIEGWQKREEIWWSENKNRTGQREE